MHLLPISLLAILAGVLLLAKTRKEALGKFFAFVSWFFVVVGFILFIGVICKVTNGHMTGHPCCQQEMTQQCPHGMHPGMGCPPVMHQGMCCPPEMQKGCCEKKDHCAKSDSILKTCPKTKEEVK
jgi:hypothetical protein